MKKLVLTKLLFLCFLFTYGQETANCGDYTLSPNVPIFQFSSISNLTVSGTDQVVADLDIVLEIEDADLRFLDVTLESPNGTVVSLLDNTCSNGFLDLNVRLSDESGSIDCSTLIGVPNLTGRFSPRGSLNDFDGEDFDGIWTLTFTDNDGGENGKLVSWCLIPTLRDPLPTDACGEYTSSPNLAIPDDGSTAENIITVSGTSPQRIGDLDITLVINHTFVPDLRITLTSPSGTTIIIGEEFCNQDNMNLILDDEVEPSIPADPWGCSGDSFLMGTFKPSSPLSVFDGEPFDGNWSLRIRDLADGDQGTLVTWCLIPTLRDPLPSETCGDYSSSPGTSIFSNQTIEDEIIISGTSPQLIEDLNIALQIDHTYTGDLDITLISPSGTSIDILFDPCTGEDNLNLILDDEALPLTCPGSGSFLVGTFQPTNPLSGFDEESFEGTWKLSVADDANGDSGSLISWCLLPTLRDPLPIDECGEYNNAPNLTIPDDMSTVEAIISVSGTSPQHISDLNIALEIEQPTNGALSIFLVSPTGTEIRLLSSLCSSSSGMNLTLDDDAASSDCPSPFNLLTGTFQPGMPLSSFDGEPFDGDWTLRITNTFTSPTGPGNLVSWCLLPTLADCGATSVGLPPAGMQSTIDCIASCDDMGWTYYIDPGNPADMVFAIDWAPDGSISAANQAAKDAAMVSIDVLSNFTTAFGLEEATWGMARYWNVLGAGAFDEPVNIKFYYNPSELTAIIDEALLESLGTSGAPYEGMSWIKTASGPYSPSLITPAYPTGVVELIPAGNGMDNGVTFVQFDGLTSFSGGTAVTGMGNRSSPLPVELTHFSGKAFDKANLLEWETRSEIDNKAFEIQASHDGGNTFNTIGVVAGAGNSSQAKQYSFTDRKFVASTYYRLKQIDFDGTATFSKVINIKNVRFENFLSVYPNPTKGNVFLSINADSNKQVNLSIYDVLGKVVQNQIVELVKGEQTMEVNLDQIGAGIYYVEVDDGNDRSVEKLIVY